MPDKVEDLPFILLIVETDRNASSHYQLLMCFTCRDNYDIPILAIYFCF